MNAIATPGLGVVDSWAGSNGLVGQESITRYRKGLAS